MGYLLLLLLLGKKVFPLAVDGKLWILFWEVEKLFLKLGFIDEIFERPHGVNNACYGQHKIPQITQIPMFAQELRGMSNSSIKINLIETIKCFYCFFPPFQIHTN